MRLFCTFAVITHSVFACSAPPAPQKPQSSTVSSAKSSGDTAQASPTPAAQTTPQSEEVLLGAKVGPDELRKKVNECNKSGTYYDRSKSNYDSACDSAVKLATFKCIEADIRAANTIKPTELDQFNAIVKQEINNSDPKLQYQFDQCVIPSTPDSDTNKQYRLKIYLAREVVDNNGTRIDTKVLRFEP